MLEATVREPSLAPLVRAARARLKALDGQLAHLRFAMDRDATIAIDGAPVEAAARRDGLLLLPGRHRVTRRMGDVTVDDEIVLAPGERRTLRTSRLRSRRPTPRPAKPAPHRATSGAPAPSLPAAEEPRPVTLGLGIGGLVGLLTGGILFALAVDKQGRLEPGCQPGCSGDVTNAQRHEVLGYAFGGTGVALMGVAGVLWWRGNTTTPESQARPAAGSSVGVRLGPQGVELRGVF